MTLHVGLKPMLAASIGVVIYLGLQLLIIGYSDTAVVRPKHNGRGVIIISNDIHCISLFVIGEQTWKFS